VLEKKHWVDQKVTQMAR